MFRARSPTEWSPAPGNPRVVMVGVPFDATQSYRPGARQGPSAVRYALPNMEFYSIELGRSLEDLSIGDAGDLEYTSDVVHMLRFVEEAVAELRDSGKSPAVVGGEHTITLASYRPFCGATLVVFDAHLDMRDEIYGLKTSHATFLRRLLESCSVELLHIGGRAFSDEELEFARSRGLKIYTSQDLDGAREALSGLSRSDSVYVSLDLDVLDPAFAPGVGNPEPGGLSSSELLQLIASLDGVSLVGFDVVELSPPYDPSGVTSAIAAKALLMLASIADRSRGPRGP
ncbi:agmatinase [Conexivisphaera calida]|uniref:agmatinase n=1 Tax=Conexivisphaera calida TaxID=1874277 RepID=UPI00157A51B7|nr:agmatinase [Conexivisphaera calida]